MSDDDVALDCTAQAALVARGEVSPLELVEAAIKRIEAANPLLNAVITPRFDQALAQLTSGRLAGGPFRGVPFLFKDYMCQSRGDPYYAGMSFLKRLEWVEPADSYLAGRFRAAGFVPLGRTNTPELALMGTTEPLAFGPTRNPWSLDHSPGGSSGGSAAAVAAGLVPAAHGNDGAGSVRIPASACGLVGLKVSRGRISAGPGPESVGGFAVEGFLTRSVRDTAAILDAVAGPMTGDPWAAPPPGRLFVDELGTPPGFLRIGLLTHAPSGIEVHPDCSAVARSAAHLLESLGHVVEEAWPSALANPDLYPGPEPTAMRIRSGASVAAQLDQWSRRTGRAIGPDDVEPTTWFVAEGGRASTAPELAGALARLQVLAREIAAWWESGFDLLLAPTMAVPPFRIGEHHAPDDPFRPLIQSGKTIPFTQPFNVTGQPAISLPLSWSDAGLPIGVQLVAASGREDLLIRVAAQLEAAQPWATRRPPPLD